VIDLVLNWVTQFFTGNSNSRIYVKSNFW